MCMCVNTLQNSLSSVLSVETLSLVKEALSRMIIHTGEKPLVLTIYFDSLLLDILLTVSKFATTCQLAVIRALVDCLLNIF